MIRIQNRKSAGVEESIGIYFFGNAINANLLFFPIKLAFDESGENNFF